MRSTGFFQDNQFWRRLCALAFPIAFQNLMLALVAAADALMLGRFHQNAMAAVSLATQVQFVQNLLLWGIVSGVGVLGAQYWGKGDRSAMGRIFGISIRQSLWICVLFFLLCRWCPEKLMLCFAHDAELVRIGAEYLKMAAWSYLLTGFSQCYLGIMKVSDHVREATAISSAAVLVNIALNALFIFGGLGFPALGVRGAALATVLARVVELAWCAGLSCRRGYLRLRPGDVLSFHRGLSLDFLRYTLPIVGAMMLWGIGFTAYTALMGHLGGDAAAANGVAAVARDLMCCLCNGLAGGCGILIGNELGAGRLLQGRRYGERSMILAFLAGGVSTLGILACIPLVSRLLPLTAQAQEYMRGMFLILSIYMIGRCVCTVVINGIFSAGGDTYFDIYSLAVCMWGVALPCAFLGAFVWKLPVLAVYACTCLDEVGKIPWVILHYRRYLWVRNITR
ncbi:MAG: MATE family efflux transporter [Oligosphaeraceae bacterium]